MKHFLRPGLLVVAPLLGLAVAACGPSGKSGAAKPDLLSANLDTTVRPGDDFYNYANGAWFKQHPIPASESNWGIGKEVQNEIYGRLRKLNEDAAKASAAPGSTEQKIGDFWATGMDSAAVNKQGLAPLQAELTRIQNISTVTGVQSAIGRLQRLGVNALFGSYVQQDAKNSDKMALYLWQAGLGLPNRDYYFNQDARTANIRQEYEKHLNTMFGLLGQEVATAQASTKSVLALETRLAGASRKHRSLARPLRQLPQDEPGPTRRPHARSQLAALAGRNGVC